MKVRLQKILKRFFRPMTEEERLRSHECEQTTGYEAYGKDDIGKFIELRLPDQVLTAETFAKFSRDELSIDVWKDTYTPGYPQSFMIDVHTKDNLPEDLVRCIMYARQQGCNRIHFNQDHQFYNEEKLKEFGIEIRA